MTCVAAVGGSLGVPAKAETKMSLRRSFVSPRFEITMLLSTVVLEHLKHRSQDASKRRSPDRCLGENGGTMASDCSPNPVSQDTRDLSGVQNCGVGSLPHGIVIATSFGVWLLNDQTHTQIHTLQQFRRTMADAL